MCTPSFLAQLKIGLHCLPLLLKVNKVLIPLLSTDHSTFSHSQSSFNVTKAMQNRPHKVENASKKPIKCQVAQSVEQNRQKHTTHTGENCQNPADPAFQKWDDQK